MKRMRTKILLTIILITAIWVACSKSAYNTKPTLEITSVNTNVVDINGTLSFQLKVTDKEGDVTDTLFVKKIRTNKKITATIRDSFALKVPEAPNSKDGTINVSLDYQNYLVSARNPIENDTLVFKFALKDKAKNISDTVSSSAIVVKR